MAAKVERCLLSPLGAEARLRLAIGMLAGVEWMLLTVASEKWPKARSEFERRKVDSTTVKLQELF